LKGGAHLALGHREDAVAAFIASFEFEPDAALEPQIEASPDARSLFQVARGQWRAQLVPAMEALAGDIAKLRLHVTAPAQAHGGEPVRISVDLVDPARLVRARRGRVSPAWWWRVHVVRAPAEPQLAFDVPAAETESEHSFVLEYHVALRHQTGYDLARDGDASHPHVIAVAAGHQPRWYELWWVRGAIAAGVVGLGAGGYLYYRSLDVGAQDVVIGRR